MWGFFLSGKILARVSSNFIDPDKNSYFTECFNSSPKSGHNLEIINEKYTGRYFLMATWFYNW